MKKTVIALLLGAALIPVAVIAGGKYGHEHRLERMAEHLQLTEQQQAEVKKILRGQREQRQALREQTRAQIDAILTDEQRATMTKHREERRKRMCERKGEHGPEGHHGGEHHGHDSDS